MQDIRSAEEGNTYAFRHSVNERPESKRAETRLRAKTSGSRSRTRWWVASSRNIWPNGGVGGHSKGKTHMDILIFTESTPTLADISMTDKPAGPAELRSSGM